MMITVIASILIVCAFLHISLQQVYRYYLLNKYKTVVELLDYFLDRSYNVIYNDQIIGYTADGQKVIPADEMETIERNFIKMTFMLMGSVNEKIFLSFYGSRTTLIDHMLIFVRKELNQDALAKLVQNYERDKDQS